MLAEARKGAPTPQDVPAGEVRAYFDAHRAEFDDPERRRVSAIMVTSEAAARDVLASLDKDDVGSWGQLVRAKSVDAQARNTNLPTDLAGDLGIVSPPGDPRGENPRVPDEVRAAVYKLARPGDVYDKPVAAGGKVYVVRLTQKLPAHERTFEESERSIRVKLAQDKLRARENDLIADLRKTVKVEIDEAALATVRTDTALVPDAAAPDAGK
jgi:parvulin-like peptidyl-prolyl isomerase